MKYKAVIIGDLHLNGADPQLIKSQITFVTQLYNFEAEEYIFLGDIFHYRSPKAEDICQFHKGLNSLDRPVHLIRGNHDTFTRDSESSILELFEKDNCDITLTVGSVLYSDTSFLAIAYEEDPEYIRQIIKQYHKSSYPVILAHFGYKGLFSPEGYDETEITVNDFDRLTFLGHIHHHSINGNVVVVGTPYTTNFSEAGKSSFIVGLKDDLTYDLIPTDELAGPRHVVLDENFLDDHVFYEHHYNIIKVICDEPDVAKIRKKIPSFVTNLTLEPRAGKFKHDPYWNGTVEVVASYLDNVETDLDKEKLKKTIEDISNAN